MRLLTESEVQGLLDQVADSIEERALGASMISRHPGTKRLCTSPQHDNWFCGECAGLEQGMMLAARFVRSETGQIRMWFNARSLRRTFDDPLPRRPLSFDHLS